MISPWGPLAGGPAFYESLARLGVRSEVSSAWLHAEHAVAAVLADWMEVAVLGVGDGAPGGVLVLASGAALAAAVSGVLSLPHLWFGRGCHVVPPLLFYCRVSRLGGSVPRAASGSCTAVRNVRKVSMPSWLSFHIARAVRRGSGV